MQTKGSFQTFIKVKHAIWLLTTNESLLVTSSPVWYEAGLCWKGPRPVPRSDSTTLPLRALDLPQTEAFWEDMS